MRKNFVKNKQKISIDKQYIQKIIAENIGLKKQLQQIQQELCDTKEQVIRDPFTSFYNVTYYDQFIQTKLTDSENIQQNAGFLYLAIDNLQKINRHYGDLIGNEIIKDLAILIKDNIPVDTIAFRLQSAIIVLYLPTKTFEQILQTAEKIRILIAESTVFIQKVTISIGAVHMSEFKNSSFHKIPELIRNTGGKRLETARLEGGNKICSETIKQNKDPEIPLIIIADTDILVLEVLENALKAEGYRVHKVYDGKALWDAIQNLNPNMVITEIFLPQIDAFEVRVRMRKISKFREIIFMIISHHKNEISIQQCRQLGIEYYLQKPLFLKEILGIVSIRLSL